MYCMLVQFGNNYIFTNHKLVSGDLFFFLFLVFAKKIMYDFKQ